MSSCPRNILMYKPNQPQFFKIILDDHRRKLSIPRKFVKNYGNKLSDSVILKVPSGDKWRVGIVKVKGQVFLGEGWHKFMECYSIVVGSLLVFRYDESNSVLDVTIFDSTCAEIDYPYRHCIINEVAAEPQVPKVESDDVVVEISSPFSPSRKRKEKSPLSSFYPHKKIKKAVENFTNITAKGTKSETKKQTQIGLQKQMAKRKTKGKSQAIYRASSSSPSQNPTFKVALCPSHVRSRNGYLEIPAKFVRKYMEKKDGDALFDVLNAKTWSVKYHTRTHSARTRTRTMLRFSSWKEFAQGNHLTVGDVCKFELIEPDKTLFKVVVFRSGTRANAGTNTKAKKEDRSLQKQIVSSKKTHLTLKEKVAVAAADELKLPKVESDDILFEISNQFSHSRERKEKSTPLCSSWPHKKMEKAVNFINIKNKVTNVEEKKENRSLTFNKRSKAVPRASSSFQSQNSTFQIKIQPSHIGDKSSRPCIPRSFATEYMKGGNGDALLNVLDGRTWSVKYSTNINVTKFMHSGWRQVVQDCYLKVGDVCNFELIDPEKTLFRVVISRSTTQEIFGSSNKQSMDRKTRIIHRKHSSSNSIQPAGNFTSGNPSFKVVFRFRSSHFNKLNVPVDFFKNIKQTSENAKLVLYGKMWYVKLLVYPNHRCGTLSAGWTCFARENCLKDGDVCTFELIDAQELLIKVSILRHSSTN